MQRKIRNRENTKDAKLMLIKLLPWIFFILIMILTASTSIADGTGLRPFVD